MRWRALWLVPVWACSSPPAHAQELAEISVGSRERSDLHYELHAKESGALLHRCSGGCVFHVPPGNYRLIVAETDYSPEGSIAFCAEPGRTSIRANPGSTWSRAAGAFFGVLGAAALPVGYVMMSQNQPNEENGSVGNPTLATVGAALFLGGIFVTPLAWIMFAKSKTSFDLKENAPIGPAIATAPKPGGGQLAMTWSF